MTPTAQFEVIGTRQTIAGQSHDEHFTEETAHGRRERRCYYTLPLPARLSAAAEWAGLQSSRIAA